jgi:hypothetical protein
MPRIVARAQEPHGAAHEVDVNATAVQTDLTNEVAELTSSTYRHLSTAEQQTWRTDHLDRAARWYTDSTGEPVPAGLSAETDASFLAGMALLGRAAEGAAAWPAG